MKNPFLRHFFLGILFYVISISRAWTTQTLNRDPVATRDDWADLTLGFYVGAGDVVVSADALLRDLFTAIDPRIRLVTAVDL